MASTDARSQLDAAERLKLSLDAVVKKCRSNPQLAHRKADEILKNLVDPDKITDDPELKQHYEALQERIHILQEYGNPESRLRSLGEIEGEYLAAVKMRNMCSKHGLKMRVGYHAHGYKGIDQIWTTNWPEKPDGCTGKKCPAQIVIVEAKTTGADLNTRPCKNSPPGAFQMDRRWVYFHAVKLAKDHKPEQPNLGECVQRKIDNNCPTVLGVVMAGGVFHDSQDYDNKKLGTKAATLECGTSVTPAIAYT